jgi:hypothetical protein
MRSSPADKGLRAMSRKWNSLDLGERVPNLRSEGRHTEMTTPTPMYSLLIHNLCA